MDRLDRVGLPVGHDGVGLAGLDARAEQEGGLEALVYLRAGDVPDLLPVDELDPEGVALATQVPIGQPTTGGLMELLPHTVQVIFAWMIFFGALAGAVAFVMWGFKWVRNYRDEKKSAIDTK